MHRVFRELLDDATGRSQHVIAVIIDIRDFSKFSQKLDSVDVAEFIRKVYMKLIDFYFPFASFYKSTGDGLLLTAHWEEKNLEEVSQKVIESCIKCHSEFGTICDDEPSINFDVPRRIGIGVARGSACCLVSTEKIKVIDYSGRLLNLTSRLTQLARPSGIVIDGSFGINLLSDEQQGYFQEDNVYLDGIAEDEPVQVYFTKEFTTIPPRNKRPIAETRWRYVEDVKPFRDLLRLGRFRYNLESEPLSPDDIKVTVEHHQVIGGKVWQKYSRYHYPQDFAYSMEAGKPILRINFPTLVQALKREGVKKNMNVIIHIAYVEK